MLLGAIVGLYRLEWILPDRPSPKIHNLETKSRNAANHLPGTGSNSSVDPSGQLVSLMQALTRPKHGGAESLT
jgi:hypothetical protein